jgi:hypothetical protein
MAISTSSQTMDPPGLLTRIKKRSIAFLKLKPTQPCWPDAKNSTGSFYDTVDGEKYWRLKDSKCTAFLEFSRLSQHLASILRKHTEAPTLPALWKAYMIGESAPLCALGILFCCGDTEYLKTAASHISASGAVDASSGVIVKYRSTLPRYKGKLIHLGLGRQMVDFLSGGSGTRGSGSTSLLMEPHMYQTPLAGDQLTERSHNSTIKALGYSPQCFTASGHVSPGDAVYVEMVDGIQAATIGGRIECGDQQLFVTAAHPFTHQRPKAKEKAANGKGRLPTRSKDAGCLYYSSCFNERPELDYALIQPRGEVSMIGGPSLQSSDSMFAFPVFTSEEDFRNLVETTVRTIPASATMMLGTLDTIPEYLQIPGVTKLQEVYAANFESVLAPGDSGSWVYNAEGDILHGHIVAGVPEDGLALIVPAHLVFADLVETFASMPMQSSKDENPPCNTLYVGNLPMDTSEDELEALFSSQRGYKRVCFRTKQNGRMCFVEFEDTSLATKALNELNGYMLHNSNKSGIKLSFSKNDDFLPGGPGTRGGDSASSSPMEPRVSLDIATAAIRDFLAGIGNDFDQRSSSGYLADIGNGFYQRSSSGYLASPALSRQSLQISDDGISEANTIVGEQRHTSMDLLRQALNGIYRPSVEGHSGASDARIDGFEEHEPSPERRTSA